MTPKDERLLKMIGDMAKSVEEVALKNKFGFFVVGFRLDTKTKHQSFASNFKFLGPSEQRFLMGALAQSILEHNKQFKENSNEEVR